MPLTFFHFVRRWRTRRNDACSEDNRSILVGDPELLGSTSVPPPNPAGAAAADAAPPGQVQLARLHPEESHSLIPRRATSAPAAPGGSRWPWLAGLLPRRPKPSLYRASRSAPAHLGSERGGVSDGSASCCEEEHEDLLAPQSCASAAAAASEHVGAAPGGGIEAGGSSPLDLEAQAPGRGTPTPRGWAARLRAAVRTPRWLQPGRASL